MDHELVAWGLRQKPRSLPPLWLFTDERRLPDPRASVGRLPRGKAGVVFRHDQDSQRAALGRDLARICRARRLILVVAGDVRLAAELRVGVHLRGGRWPAPLRARALITRGLVTSSAHSIPDLRRAWAAGAGLVFLSPAYPTASHADAAGLGPLRWAAMARGAIIARGAVTKGTTARPRGTGIAALGGVDGNSVKRLPARLFQAVGAIGALSST